MGKHTANSLALGFKGCVPDVTASLKMKLIYCFFCNQCLRLHSLIFFSAWRARIKNIQNSDATIQSIHLSSIGCDDYE